MAEKVQKSKQQKCQANQQQSQIKSEVTSANHRCTYKQPDNKTTIIQIQLTTN